ncbi:unnamed protein product [Malus baccata var. baccata]|uniref:Uncharacterized protein n=1 Tax=Malus domestica TaxID=3750 RepID=A0A498HNT1_MALDO|nr:hypothetical protein DVH24_012800 [Malus domestica]
MIQKFLGTWLPTVMTASFAFTLPVLSIINDYSDRNFRSEHETLKGSSNNLHHVLLYRYTQLNILSACAHRLF